MIDMRVAQKNISRRGRQIAATKLFAERNDAGAGVEDQPAAIHLDFDTGRVAADAERFRINSRITAAHAPKTQPKTGTLVGGARSLGAHLNDLFGADDVESRHRLVNALEAERF